jgi:hypothetical protein
MAAQLQKDRTMTTAHKDLPALYKLTRSIIHDCPALVLPQSFIEKLGNCAQIVVLKGASQEIADALLAKLNADQPGEPNVQDAAKAVFHVLAPDHVESWDDLTSAQRELYECVARAALARPEPASTPVAAELAPEFKRLLPALREIQNILIMGTVTIDKIHELGADGPAEEVWLVFHDDVMPLLDALEISARPRQAPDWKPREPELLRAIAEEISAPQGQQSATPDAPEIYEYPSSVAWQNGWEVGYDARQDQQSARAGDECARDVFSSRMCERGTASCIVEHAAKADPAQEAGRDAALEKALDKEFPIPDSPHDSVMSRAYSNREAFERGYRAAQEQPQGDAS